MSLLLRCCLLAGLSVLSAQTAHADTIEYTETRRTITQPDGRRDTTETVTTTTTTPQAVPIGSVASGVFVTTLSGRRAQLEKAIAAGQASGTISEAQAQRLRARLDEVARAEASSQSDPQAMLPLVFTLDQVGNTVHELVPTAIFDPLVTTNRVMLSDGRIIMLDDLMVRRAELESRISRELAEGKLTPKQVAELRADLTNIARVEQRLRAGGRTLNYKDSRMLYKLFDKVGSKLDRYA